MKVILYEPVLILLPSIFYLREIISFSIFKPTKVIEMLIQSSISNCCNTRHNSPNGNMENLEKYAYCKREENKLNCMENKEDISIFSSDIFLPTNKCTQFARHNSRQNSPNVNMENLGKSACCNRGENKLNCMENKEDISTFGSDIFLPMNTRTQFARKNSRNHNMKQLEKYACCKRGENKLNCMKDKEDFSIFSPDNSLPTNKCIEFASGWKGIVYKSTKLPKENTLTCNNKSSKWGGIVYTRRRLKKPCSQEVIFAKPSSYINSTRDFCISILQLNGLLVGENCTIYACESSDAKSTSYAYSPQSCKICRRLGNPLEMLICDVCEGAFHLSCYHPKVKNMPIDYWFCLPCHRKSSRNLVDIMNERRNYHGEGGPIMCMLRDDQPFMSGVRIGNDYQAEVSEWSGPLTSEDFSSEPLSLLDHSIFADDLGILNAEKISTSSFIGNWIQCRAVICKSSKDEGTICGKWRRAPLFVMQTDKWDCSCCVLWDPMHADCVVPQELPTDVILQHLKYLEMLQPNLNN